METKEPMPFYLAAGRYKRSFTCYKGTDRAKAGTMVQDRSCVDALTSAVKPVANKEEVLEE